MKNRITVLSIICICLLALPLLAQKKTKKRKNKQATVPATPLDMEYFNALKWRNIGPFRGGRSVAACGVPNNPMLYYMGSTGGGIWKTEDAGITWNNISDGQLKTGSVGAIAVAPSDANVIYVGMGEHAIRGVMTSHGDGVYKSVDAGKTWKHIGLLRSRHIARIRIHPKNPDVVYVAVQGAAYGANTERGVYKSTDGGNSWEKVLYVDDNTGAAELSMDVTNPRILYAAMWEHRRYPWTVKSGGAGSGLYKSTDSGKTWEKLEKGLPDVIGKSAIDVSSVNPNLVFANIEAEGEKGGVYRSDDGGKSWKQTSKDRITVARSWYYMEIYADPVDENVVYVMNAPFLKSIDGGKTFKVVPVPHGDQHDLWVNPTNNKIMINANDGGVNISFNGGKSWSSQQNQPTAQFYRIITDNRFPYHVYAGQQDNSTMAIASRTNGGGIGWKDWYPVAGGESAFIAFDPDNPRYVYGGSYQGNISEYDHVTKETKDIMSYPFVGLSWEPNEMKYRFNWNAPIVSSPQNRSKIYHGGNVVLKTEDRGQSWVEISGDLTRNDKTKQGKGGIPFTNEAAGGENYNTISYIAASQHQEGVLWVGSDDGLVHLTQDDGKTWTNVTPKGIGECLINAIEVSPHDEATAYIAVTKYKFNDFTPMAFKTNDFGKTWTEITNGFAEEDYVRVIREDKKKQGLLYAGTETGLYISFDDGKNWTRFQSNLPVCPINDMIIQDNDLVIATSGRGFWILDDLGALQQIGDDFEALEKMKKDIQNTSTIFQPKPSVRLDAGSGKIPNYGQNPLTGVILDYYLPQDMEDDTITLEIIDSDKKIIRTYTNQKTKSVGGYPGAPAPTPVLPSKKGINRFNWDMKTEPLEGIQDVFVLGNYNAPMVAPGEYSVRLSTKLAISITTFKIIPDPRLSASAEDYAAQQTVFNTINQSVADIHQSVIRMRKVKGQIQHYISILEEQDNQKALLEQATAIQTKIETWEQALIQPDQKTFQDVINFRNRLNADFMNLRSRANSHDPKPTQGVQSRLKELVEEWQGYKATLTEIIEKDMVAFGKAFKASSADVLVVPKK